MIVGTAEEERERCSKILEEAIAFVVKYPTRKDLKQPISKDFRHCLGMMKMMLEKVKHDIDLPKRDPDFSLQEMERAEEVMSQIQTISRMG